MSHVSHIPLSSASRRPPLGRAVALVVAAAIVPVLLLATIGAGTAPNSSGEGGGAGRPYQHPRGPLPAQLPNTRYEEGTGGPLPAQLPNTRYEEGTRGPLPAQLPNTRYEKGSRGPLPAQLHNTRPEEGSDGTLPAQLSSTRPEETAAVIPAALFAGRGSAAQSTPLPFTFYLTHYELLGDPNDPTGVRYHSSGRPFAKARDGSRIILTGQGGWDPASARAAGGGEYTLRGPRGAVKARGTWRVTRFISFLQLAGWWGIPGFQELGWQGPPGSASFSGFLKVKVKLENRGAGVLTAWCLMPEVRMPGDHISDGISLSGRKFRFTDYHGTERSLEGVMFYGPGTPAA